MYKGIMLAVKSSSQSAYLSAATPCLLLEQEIAGGISKEAERKRNLAWKGVLERVVRIFFVIDWLHGNIPNLMLTISIGSDDCSVLPLFLNECRQFWEPPFKVGFVVNDC